MRAPLRQEWVVFCQKWCLLLICLYVYLGFMAWNNGVGVCCDERAEYWGCWVGLTWVGVRVDGSQDRWTWDDHSFIHLCTAWNVLWVPHFYCSPKKSEAYPFLKLTVRTWKWMVLEYDRFLLGWPVFRGYVSSRECTFSFVHKDLSVISCCVLWWDVHHGLWTRQYLGIRIAENWGIYKKNNDIP